MADLSLLFDPSDMVSKTAKASSIAAVASDLASSAMIKATAASDVAATASNKASQASVAAAKGQTASSKIAASSGDWDKATAASSVAAAASNAASALSVKLQASFIKSVPGTNSFAVHNIMITAASSIKYVYSSTAA